jgi:hypothetical protein
LKADASHGGRVLALARLGLVTDRIFRESDVLLEQTHPYREEVYAIRGQQLASLRIQGMAGTCSFVWFII